jgi:hypothetical protein
MVCRSWRAAVIDAPLLLDIRPQLAHWSERDATTTLALATRPRLTRASAAAVASAPPALMRGRRLAAWLATHKGCVRTLHIPLDRAPSSRQAARPGWEQDLTTIMQALTVPRGVAGPVVVLPHLVSLELPVLGLAGMGAFLQSLAGCPSLQQLHLEVAFSMVQDVSEPVSYDQAASAVAPLKQLQALYLEWPDPWKLDAARLPSLLQQLPPSLTSLYVSGYLPGEGAYIPLSCVTHLVNMREWRDHHINSVVDDRSGITLNRYRFKGDINPFTTTTTTSSSSSNGSSSGGTWCMAQVLTALTRLECLNDHDLDSTDMRLQLPSLKVLRLNNASWDAWLKMQGLHQLQKVTVDDLRGVAGLGALTQVRELDLKFWGVRIQDDAAVKRWAEVVPKMAQLVTLRLCAHALLDGEFKKGPGLLAPVTQVSRLTIWFADCFFESDLPEDAWELGWAGTPSGAVVQMVADALGDGKGRLQQLVLEGECWDVEGEQVQSVTAAARTAVPGVEVMFHTL